MSSFINTVSHFLRFRIFKWKHGGPKPQNHPILKPYYNDAPCPRMSASPLDVSQDIPRCFDILSALPVELSLHILYLIQQPSTLGRISMICKAWNILVQDESIWRLQSERFGYVPMNRGGDWRGWKDYFIKLYISGRVYHIVSSLETLKGVL